MSEIELFNMREESVQVVSTILENKFPDVNDEDFKGILYCCDVLDEVFQGAESNSDFKGHPNSLEDAFTKLIELLLTSNDYKLLFGFFDLIEFGTDSESTRTAYFDTYQDFYSDFKQAKKLMTSRKKSGHL